MLSDLALTRALERVGLRAPVRFDEVTRSTQERALTMAAGGAPEWTLVAAGHQTQGRGRLGRRWRDEPGRALMFSVVLRPELSPELGGLLTLLAGACLVEAARRVTGRSASCKWPNDILVDERKAGGILAESVVAGDRFEHVVLGVGVNLGSAPPGVPDAGALDAGDEELLRAFLETFVRRYEPAHPAFAASVVDAYRPVCATIGRRVRARTTAGTTVEGTAVDVDEAGGLVVRTEGGPLVVRFGAIEHLE
jgi:BirA family biotin operon repressor/biotin-[acetyl-CoA-carboxylase] ligase